jgi:two-component system, NarL family, sensor kinase
MRGVNTTAGHPERLAVDHERASRFVAVGSFSLLALVVLLVAVASVELSSTGLPLGRIVLSYAVTDAWLGLTFAPFGALVAYRRPGSPLGWLFLAFSVFYATSAAGFAVAAATSMEHSVVPAWLQVVAFDPWTLSVAFCFPMILLLFPDGTLAGRSSRWLVGFAALDGIVWVGSWAAVNAPAVLAAHGSAASVIQRTETISNLGLLVVFIACLFSLLARWRRTTGRLHAQLAWLAVGSTVAVCLFLPTAWGVSSGWATALLLGVPLFPVACAGAILRHRLFDLDIALNRTLVYLTLSAGVLAIYLALVGLARAVIGGGGGVVGSLLAAALIAIVFAPSRAFVQKAVGRLLFGNRSDPAKTVSSLAATLEMSRDDELLAALGAMRQSLRLHAAVIETDGRQVGIADPTATPERFPLRFRDQVVGELAVWPRRGQRQLAASDREAIRVIAGPLASAVYSAQLTDRLQQSRQELISARGEERRRLHRDLHDGIGPALTAVALKADAASNVVADDPGRAGKLLGQISTEARSTIDEVRRIAHDLRPPTLERYGLLDSVSYEAHRFTSRLDGHPLVVSVALPPSLPPLADPVTTAAYRIVSEALTNVARHSNASHAHVEIRCRDKLALTIVDDGTSESEAWAEGFGLASMRTRAADAGGSLVAGPCPSGGKVSAEFPLTPAGASP